ncbi:MAG TPA: DoxX family protein [bacterium]|nr:DoxX family protein [bacterium]
MWHALFATDPTWTGFILRLALGLMIFPHGAQKLLGLFGGYGFKGTMGYFTGSLGIPYVFGVLAILAEFFGGLGLILGLFGRVAALGVGATMVVAALTAHRQNGFFMNWTGQQQGEGYEFHLLAAAIAVAILVLGSGAFSLDYAITQWLS